MTVHKAKGLEFPVVYLPGLVTGRFPAIGRREPLGLPLELVHETLPEGDYQLQEERRLCYVGMTRARDELVLSHAADYGGQRARRVSPFVLEALDLPVADGVPGAGARASTPLERLAGPRADRGRAGATARPRRRAADALVLRRRRLPDLPAEVQVRPPAAGPARPASLADLRLRAPRRGRGVPPPARARRRDERGAAVRLVRGRVDQRRVPVPRARGGAAGGGPRGAAHGSATAQLDARRDHPRVRGARVQLPPRRRPRPGPDGPGRHRAPGPVGAGPGHGRRAPASGADVVEPTLRPGAGAGRDHRLQVVRRPRPRAGPPAGEGLAPAVDLRDGLRGDDRAAAGRGRAALPRLGPRRDGPGRPAPDRQGARRRSGRRPRASAPATSRPSPTTCRAAGARSARSARPASPDDRRVARRRRRGGRSRASSPARRTAPWSRPTTSTRCARCPTAAWTSPTPTRRSRPARPSG